VKINPRWDWEACGTAVELCCWTSFIKPSQSKIGKSPILPGAKQPGAGRGKSLAKNGKTGIGKYREFSFLKGLTANRSL
jgi:hypothetical protein